MPPPFGVGGTGGSPARDAGREVARDTTPADPPETAPPPDMMMMTGGTQPIGTACTKAADCQSGFCVEGVCCNSACTAMCSACKVPGLVGTCVQAPVGEDPHNDCPAEPPATCGRAGGCNGMGRCLMHQLGTECSPQTCTAGMETAAGRCSGPGLCTPGTSRSCAPFECGAGRCVTGCSTANPCNPGFTCTAGRCIAAGPALHWRFDEEAGPTASDASGNNYHGTYIGMSKMPEPNTSVPMTAFANPRSRQFANNGRPAVQLAMVPAALRPANEITIGLWYRATTAANGGTDVFNLGGDLILRLRPGDVEFSKRVSMTAGMTYAINRVPNVTALLDGKWHHLAAVTSSTGMRLYLDGKLLGSVPRGEPVLYTGATQALYCGRDPSAAGRDFAGGLDDVRIYTRALTAEEVMSLAQGAL